MIYNLLVDGKRVAVVKSNNAVETYIREHHPDRAAGLSRKTIRRQLNASPEDIFTRNGITIERVNNQVNRRRTPREIRNFEERIQLNTQTLDYGNNPLFVNEANVYYIIEYITDKIKERGLDFLQNHRVKVALDGQGAGAISTPFLNFNELFERLYEDLVSVLEEYDADEFTINQIGISFVEVPDPEDIIIYRSKKVDNLLKDILNRQIEDKETFIKYLSNKKIISPATNKNCFIKACFISSKGVENPDIRDFITDKLKKKTRHTAKELTPILGRHLKNNIRVKFVDSKIITKDYIFNPEWEMIEILIKGGHAYALVEGKTENIDPQVLIEPPEYRDEKGWRIATYDLETCDKEEKAGFKNNTIVYAVGYHDGKIYKEFYKKRPEDEPIKKFIDFIEKVVRNKTIIYAHNGGRFDTFILLKELILSEKFIITNYLESNGRIINLTIKTTNKKSKEIKFRDSYNFITSSLDKACKDFKPKTKKLTDLVDHDKININNCYTKEIYDYTSQYLKNDCYSLYEVLVIFDNILMSKYGFGIRSSLTNASTARRVFLEKHYDKEKYPLYTLPSDIDAEIRKYYYGGRNEVGYKIGHSKGKFYYVDFTSLYPFVQANNPYPYGEVERFIIPEENKGIYPSKAIGFFKVRFRHKRKDKRPLHAVVRNHKLVFPYCDNWEESIIYSNEIKYSIENDLGYEYEFLEVFSWKKQDYIFKGIINELYQMKIDAQNAGNKALRSIAKIIINSTYGFFGINYLKRDQTEIIHERASKTKTAEESRECRYYGYLLDNKLKDRKKVGKYDIYKLEDGIPPTCANVAIASAITSNARLELYKLLSKIDEVGGKVYYCDTDSAITDYNIYEDDRFKKFIGSGGENLGELTNETEEDGGYYTDIITLGNKAYALRNPKLKKNPLIIKLKGINSKMTYDKKEIDHEKKEIVFRGINKLEGKEKLTFDDYILLSHGYKAINDNMTFLTGSNSILFKDNGIIKQRNEKKTDFFNNSINKYDKAIVDNEGFITPLIL
ncbi:MAG: DNA polymerase [Promethearchaeota archaeon]|jgi:hypothetical protein